VTFSNIFGSIIAFQRTSGTASANPTKVSMTADCYTGAHNVAPVVSNTGSASLAQDFPWSWKPNDSDCPIRNKDVRMTIGGNATASAAISITGDNFGDAASASVSFDASASGSVGGQQIVGMQSNPAKTLDLTASLKSGVVTYHAEISGKLEKTKGGGSVGGQADTTESKDFTGVPSLSRTLTISANIEATGNTNNVRVYGIGYNQAATAALAASCSNAGLFFGSNSSSASVNATANFIVTEN
jgi:hypothetical protein